MVLTAVELPTVEQVIQASKKEPFPAARLGFDLALIAELMLRTREHVPTDKRAAPGLGGAVAPSAVIDALDRMIRYRAT